MRAENLTLKVKFLINFIKKLQLFREKTWFFMSNFVCAWAKRSSFTFCSCFAAVLQLLRRFSCAQRSSWEICAGAAFWRENAAPLDVTKRSSFAAPWRSCFAAPYGSSCVAWRSPKFDFLSQIPNVCSRTRVRILYTKNECSFSVCTVPRKLIIGIVSDEKIYHI